MTKFRMHNYVSTSARILLGLFFASNFCLSTAWSDCSDLCKGSQDPNCVYNCTQGQQRRGGCGFVSGVLVDRRPIGGSIQLENNGRVLPLNEKAMPPVILQNVQTCLNKNTLIAYRNDSMRTHVIMANCR